MKKGLIAVFLLVLLVGGGLAAGYAMISANTESSVRNLVATQPMVELAAYERGLTRSTFQLNYPALGCRLDGQIDHGPLLVAGLTPALDRVSVRLNPEVAPESPLAEALKQIPELSQAVVEVMVGYGGSVTVDGAFPAIDREVAVEGETLRVRYSGGQLTGSGEGQIDALDRLDLAGDLGLLQLSGEGLEFSLGPMRLEEQVRGMRHNLPENMVATVVADGLTVRGTDQGQPLSLEAKAIRFIEEAGMTNGQTLYGKGGFSIDQLVVNGEQIDQLSYQVSVKGLKVEPVLELQRILADFQARAQQGNPDALMAEFTPRFLPQLHAMVAGAAEMGVEIQGQSVTYGKNQFRVNAALADGGADYLQRLQGRLDLDVAEPLAHLLATLYMMQQGQANPQAQMPPPDQLLQGLVQQQMIQHDAEKGQYRLGVQLDGAQDSLRLDAGMELPPPSMLAQMVAAGMAGQGGAAQ